jgi:hypothetical protein
MPYGRRPLNGGADNTLGMAGSARYSRLKKASVLPRIEPKGRYSFASLKRAAAGFARSRTASFARTRPGRWPGGTYMNTGAIVYNARPPKCRLSTVGSAPDL